MLCVLQCDAVCCRALQCVAGRCRALQCVAVCCSVLQCVAVCCSVYTYMGYTTATCNFPLRQTRETHHLAFACEGVGKECTETKTESARKRMRGTKHVWGGYAQ